MRLAANRDTALRTATLRSNNSRHGDAFADLRSRVATSIGSMQVHYPPVGEKRTATDLTPWHPLTLLCPATPCLLPACLLPLLRKHIGCTPHRIRYPPVGEKRTQLTDLELTGADDRKRTEGLPSSSRSTSQCCGQGEMEGIA